MLINNKTTSIKVITRNMYSENKMTASLLLHWKTVIFVLFKNFAYRSRKSLRQSGISCGFKNVIGFVLWQNWRPFCCCFNDKWVGYISPIAVQQAGSYYPVSCLIFFWQFVDDWAIRIEFPKDLNFCGKRQKNSAVLLLLDKFAVFVFNFIPVNIDPSWTFKLWLAYCIFSIADKK